MPKDKGTWEIASWRREDGRIVIESTDFTHDADLTIYGDFGNEETRREYAQDICDRLNRTAEGREGDELARALRNAEKYETALRHIAEHGFASKDWQYARDVLNGEDQRKAVVK